MLPQGPTWSVITQTPITCPSSSLLLSTAALCLIAIPRTPESHFQLWPLCFVSSASDVLPPSTSVSSPHTYFRSLLKSHFLSEVFFSNWNVKPSPWNVSHLPSPLYFFPSLHLPLLCYFPHLSCLFCLLSWKFNEGRNFSTNFLTLRKVPKIENAQ